MPLHSNGTLAQGGGASNALQALAQRLSKARQSAAGSAQGKVGARGTGSATHPAARSSARVAGSAGNEVGARSRSQGEGGRDYLAETRSAAADKTAEQGAEGQGAEAEAEAGAARERVGTVSDPFMAMFERYSADNLDNMSLGDFLQTDGSQEDRDMWRAFTSDPMMGRYYSDAIDEAGGFDQWYDQMTGVTIDDIMADPSLQYAHFGGSDDTVHSIHGWASQQGWVPDVSGSGADSENLAYLFGSDPSLAASVMDYMFAMNALNNQEGATDVFSVDEMNNLLALDGLQYGYGDDYTYGDHSVPDEGEQFLAVDPEFWAESLEKGWSSVPGYGLSNRGAAGLMRERYDTGYMRRPGVDDAYAAYAQQQGGDQQ